ncbi:hypothetical protein C8Q80DRAFT_1117928 [Daedaleopsis nitida]|nr:hypothetical protein C8Q80DRAFT_1117928 [Daedaleopsis nitida]
MSSPSFLDELDLSNTTYSVPGDRVEELSSVLGNVSSGLHSLGRDWVSQKLNVQIYEIILSSVFSGLYTILVLIAIYLLCRKGLKNVHVIVMLFIILTLYTSTTVYWATLLCEAFHELGVILRDISYEATRVDTIVSNFRQAVLSNGTSALDPNLSSAVENELKVWWPRPMQECVGTATLTLNVVVGDAVVWWRALVLYNHSPTRRCIYSLLLVAFTLIPGVIVTMHGCNPSSSLDPIVLASGAGTATVTSGAFYIRDKWGLAASVLSLVANVMATSLIVYKTWRRRSLVRLHLGIGSARTSVGRALELLIASGTAYSILWLLIVVYQAGAISLGSGDSAMSTFIYRFHFVVEGCLIALIGIYPTLVILLVAMNRSLSETTSAGSDGCSNLRFSPHPHDSPSGTTTRGSRTAAPTVSHGSQCILHTLPTRSTYTMSMLRDARRSNNASQESITATGAEEEKRKRFGSETGLDLA